MKTRTILFLSIFLCFLNANAQFYSSMNTVYYSSPSITFYNPAPPVLIGRPYAFAGMQLLHLGLSEDNLRNNFVTLVEPVGSSTAIGLRAQYFTSNIFQKGNYSLLISQKVYKNIFSIGLNANFLTFGYNTSKFKLFDFHDPVINDGTSQNAISYGAGIFMQPIHGLLLGASADHLNKPDISLDKSSILQERIYHFGLALCFLPVIPQFDVRMEGNEILKQGGLHLDLLNHRLDIFAGYNQFSFGGSGIFAQLEMSFGDIGILYSYQNPLTEDFNHVSNGSHQIGIFYTKSKTPIPPKIYLEDNPSRQSLPQFTLIGRIESPDGLKLIEIYDNQDLIKRIECSDNIKTKEINEPFNLKKGDNKIRVVAYASKLSTTEKTFVLFEPQSPEIKILSLQNTQLREKDYVLHLTVKDRIGVDQLQLFQDGREIKTLTSFNDPQNIELQQPIVLREGKNNLQIIALNKWEKTQISPWLVYKSKEAPPELSIDSPQRPISASSSVTVNLQLDNYKKIKEVVIKINGKAVDTVKVYKTRGMDHVAVTAETKFERKAVINLKSPENLIEAVAVDEENIPRTSRTMDILYNPYAREMKYARKWAIVVGIDDYRDKRITKLDKAVSDARSVAKLLTKHLGFDRVDTLFNEKATFENLNAILSDTLLKAKKNDLVLFYFSGHGDQISNTIGEDIGYIVPYDADLFSVSKKISMSFINQYAKQSEARDILYIIDACYSGLGIIEKPKMSYDEQKRAVVYKRLKNEVEKRGRNIISAGGKEELAIDGLFTQILDQGLLGAADYNHDAYITFTELGMYVKQRVSEIAKKQYQRRQNPQFGSIISDRGECAIEQKKD